MKINPISDDVFRNVTERLQQVFNCIVIPSTSNDRIKVLERFLGGKKPKYPYIFVTLQTVSNNPESYVSSRMARRGLTTVMDAGSGYNVRLVPANYEFQIDFVTNLFQGLDVDNVMAFSSRWLMARRCGWLKFNINYGRLQFLIGVTLSDSVSIPVLENKAETEAAYTVTTTMTVHAYVSEPQLKEQALITDVEVNGVLMNADGSMPNNSQFMSFNSD